MAPSSSWALAGTSTVATGMAGPSPCRPCVNRSIWREVATSDTFSHSRWTGVTRRPTTVVEAVAVSLDGGATLRNRVASADHPERRSPWTDRTWTPSVTSSRTPGSRVTMTPSASGEILSGHCSQSPFPTRPWISKPSTDPGGRVHLTSMTSNRSGDRIVTFVGGTRSLPDVQATTLDSADMARPTANRNFMASPREVPLHSGPGRWPGPPRFLGLPGSRYHAQAAPRRLDRSRISRPGPRLDGNLRSTRLRRE